MLQNAYLLAKIGADTAENEQHFAKNLRKLATGAERGSPRGQRRTGSWGAARPLPAACLVQVSAFDPRFGQCVGFEHLSFSCLHRQCFETFKQEPNFCLYEVGYLSNDKTEKKGVRISVSMF